MNLFELIEKVNFDAKFVKPKEFHSKKVAYGTAGFRTKASDLDWVLYRMGLLAALRSICQDCQYIGCMITASHNPEEDNGCKLVDPLGDMLEEKWETFATDLVNSNDLRSTIKNLCQNELKSSLDRFNASHSKQANLVVAHDTRPSCALLLDGFKTGAELLQANVVYYGLLTTPQLHYMVRCLNTNGEYGEPSELGYFNKISKAFFNVWSMIDFNNNGKYETDLYVDCANGVGAPKLKILSESLTRHLSQDSNQNNLSIHLFNEGKNKNDILNHLVGADHVKVQQKPPLNLPIEEKSSSIRKFCSLDGDADRIVYYYIDNEKKFRLLDGDKIASIAATHLKELVQNAHLSEKIRLSIVQTAYANGSSTNFIENVMKVNVSCVPTGVKHLHHEAQKCDIGVYFEANGHGTVLFSDKAEKIIEEQYRNLITNSNQATGSTEKKKWIKENPSIHALYTLKHLKDCINQTVGDALCDMLLVELILGMRQLSVVDWNKMYTDLPSRQLKVTIKDRTLIKTIDAERRVSQPAELQRQIDALVSLSNSKEFRAFVRPSGTEDVVRVYAEADTQENCDKLAKQVSQLVFDLAGGVGNRP